MAKKVRWAVIGSGGIASRRTIPEGITKADNAELVSVYDVDGKVNAEVAKQFGATAVTNIEDMLASDIDAVYIATPAKVHFEQAVACAKAGKNVLCEKPLGMTVGQAEQMIGVFESAGVLLGTGFMMRFNSQHRAALKMIQEGVLKDPEVSAAIGLHIWNDLPCGKVGIRHGPLLASVDRVKIKMLLYIHF